MSKKYKFLILFIFTLFKLYSQNIDVVNSTPKYIKGLSYINLKDFNKCKSDSFNIKEISRSEFESFKLLNSIRIDQSDFETRCYCDLTYSKYFKTLILIQEGGGDCYEKLLLINIKNDTLISQMIISNSCGTDIGEYNRYSKFLNDSTFIEVIESNGIKRDKSGNPIEGFKFYSTMKSIYRIMPNGKIEFISKEENERKEKL